MSAQAQAHIPLTKHEPSALALGLRWIARRSRQKPLAAVSGVLLIGFCIVGAFAPFFATHDPLATDVSRRLLAPSGEHWMGTDGLGRDLYSRVVYGARVSLAIGLSVTAGSTIIGVLLGIMSGYLGGKVDLIMQRFVDVLMSFPLLVLALLVIAVLGPSTINVGLTLLVAMSTRPIRVIRSSVLALKQEIYITAAQAMGANTLRIMLRHLLPNVVAPALVVASISLGSVILI
ncbi:MAG: ABC transporter permease, partial [Dehalococcoidia bacterium]